MTAALFYFAGVITLPVFAYFFIRGWMRGDF